MVSTKQTKLVKASKPKKPICEKPYSNKHLSVELWKMAKFFNGVYEKLSANYSNLLIRVDELEKKTNERTDQFNNVNLAKSRKLKEPKEPES
jgi:hypothetical protein